MATLPATTHEARSGRTERVLWWLALLMVALGFVGARITAVTWALGVVETGEHSIAGQAFRLASHWGWSLPLGFAVGWAVLRWRPGWTVWVARLALVLATLSLIPDLLQSARHLVPILAIEPNGPGMAQTSESLAFPVGVWLASWMPGLPTSAPRRFAASAWLTLGTPSVVLLLEHSASLVEAAGRRSKFFPQLDPLELPMAVLFVLFPLCCLGGMGALAWVGHHRAAQWVARLVLSVGISLGLVWPIGLVIVALFAGWHLTPLWWITMVVGWLCLLTGILCLAYAETLGAWRALRQPPPSG